MDQTPIIRTSNLTKCYDEVIAVSDLNLEIYKGEVFGLLGPNGAGKTTTTLMLLGLTEPASGSAYIDGFDCTREPLSVKKIVSYLPDSVGFYPEMTGRENLCFTGRLNGLDRETSEERADALLARVGMTFAADRRAGTYSRGMKQRLGIADVLMKDPKVIIMDEPTLGIDPEGINELIALIRELSVQDGRTILISSHQLYQIQQICDRVGIFVKGKLIACGKIEELGRQLEQEGSYVLDLQVENEDEKLTRLLLELPGVSRITPDADGLLHLESTQDVRREVTRVLAENSYLIRQLKQRGGDLDEIYRRYFEKAGEQSDSSGIERKTRMLRDIFRRKKAEQ